MDAQIIQGRQIYKEITKELKKNKTKTSVYTWGSSLLGKKDFREKKKVLLYIFSPGGCIKAKNQINTILVLDGGDSMRTSVL